MKQSGRLSWWHARKLTAGRFTVASLESFAVLHADKLHLHRIENWIRIKKRAWHVVVVVSPANCRLIQFAIQGFFLLDRRKAEKWNVKTVLRSGSVPLENFVERKNGTRPSIVIAFAWLFERSVSKYTFFSCI
jgi:hypothetical protein